MPPSSTRRGSRVRRRPSASFSSSIGNRRVGVHLPVAVEPRAVGRRDERRRVVELGHQAVELAAPGGGGVGA